LTGTYFFVASAATLLSYTDLGPDTATQIGTLGQRIGDEEVARAAADSAIRALIPFNVENYTGTSTQKWQAAIAAAVAATTATTLGVLAAPRGTAYTITTGLDAAARIGLDCAGVRITTSGTFTALTIGPSPNDSAHGGGQRPHVLHPPEIVNGTPSTTGTTPGLLLRAMPQCRVVDAMGSGWPVAFDMIGNCYGTVWDNPHARASVNKVGLRVRGVNLAATDAGAGNDITIRNPWLGGRDAGIWVDPRASAIHVQQGQVNAGEGLASAADTAGAICWGRNLDDASDEQACGQIDLDGVSFEGTQFAWCLRGFAFAHVSAHKTIPRSDIAGKPIIGVVKAPQSGTFDFRKTEIYGPFTSAQLAVVTLSGSGHFFDESGTAMSATVGAAADGTGGSAPAAGASMASQGAITAGVVTDMGGPSATPRLIVGGVTHSPVVKEQATIADDAIFVFSSRAASNLALYWLVPFSGAMAQRHGYFTADGATVTGITSGASVAYGNVVLTDGAGDGVDGSINVYPASANTIGVKNRLGGPVTLSLVSITA
jgi:hypothetical protein